MSLVCNKTIVDWLPDWLTDWFIEMLLDLLGSVSGRDSVNSSEQQWFHFCAVGGFSTEWDRPGTVQWTGNE